MLKPQTVVLVIAPETNPQQLPHQQTRPMPPMLPPPRPKGMWEQEVPLGLLAGMSIVAFLFGVFVGFDIGYRHGEEAGTTVGTPGPYVVGNPGPYVAGGSGPNLPSLAGPSR